MEIDYLGLSNWFKLYLIILHLSFTWVFNTQFYIKHIEAYNVAQSGKIKAPKFHNFSKLVTGIYNTKNSKY